MAEQPNAKSETGKELKSPDEMKSMSLTDMEKELTSKDYSTYKPVNDQEQKDSENESEDDSKETEQEDSTTQDEEQSSTEEESESTDDTEEESTEEDDSSTESKKTDKQKDKTESAEDRLSKLEKNYKELQGDYTKKSQKLKQVEAELAQTKVPKKDDTSTEDDNQEEDDPELSQLKAKDPKAYNALNKLVDRMVERRVKEKVKPVEEAVTLRKRQENASAFNKASEDFLNSPLKELESELVGIINENPGEWQRTIWENGAEAFNQLEAKLYLRNKNKVAKLLSQAEKSEQSGSTKQDRLKTGQVGTKTKVTKPTRDVMSNSDFSKLTLAEMEKRLPKVRN